MTTQPAQLQRGIVKSAQSGDSIIVRGQPKGGPPPEKQINLAYLIAPKISRKMPDGTHTADEPFAWESREFLRKKLIGKEISFRVEYKLPFGGAQRECAIVMLGNENINELLVQEGLVEVVKRSQNKDNPDVIRLIELEEAAKSASLGKWGGKLDGKRTILQEVETPSQLLNKTFDGIVEHVRDGSTMRVGLFIPHSDHYQMITVVLSGVRSPQTNETFGEEARFFTETRLLQRDVKVRVEQANNNPGSFVGTVSFMDRNIADYLVQEGYAKCLDWTIGLTQDPKKLRALEREAKTKKFRLWRDYKEPSSSGGGNSQSSTKSTAQNFEAKVMEISNADSLMVQNVETKEIRKIFIASVRPPRLESKVSSADGSEPVVQPSPVDRKQFRPLYDIPHMFEAREFLRKKLIGKTVKVHVDYVQPKTDNFPEKTCCTVITTADNVNIGEALLSRGLVSLVKYRMDNDERASDYDSFLAAEMKAQKNLKGIHSTKQDAGVVRIADLSADQTKSKSFAPFLTRTTGLRREAVVEYVFPSSTKVKVYIPKENCLLNLVLSGVNTPKMNDPICSEAVQYARLRILHRDVHVEIEATDKVGNYIGSLYYDKNSNLALELVRNGFLSVRDYNKHVEYNNAEQEAKSGRKGIWKDWQEEVVEIDNGIESLDITNVNDGGGSGDEMEDLTDPNSATSTTPAAAAVPVISATVDDLSQRRKVVVTNLSADFSSFHAQSVLDGPKLEELMVRLRDEAKQNPPTVGAYSPKRGDLVMARFSEDKQWYRVRVEKLISGTESQVIYIDYGNREVLPNKEIASLPLGNFTTSLPPVAKEYGFAFVFSDKDPEFVDEVRAVFQEETAEKVLLLKSEYKDLTTGLDAATLVNEELKKDVVHQMVADGWLFVDTKTRRERRLLRKFNEYKDAQETAKKNGLNLWQYGDVSPDDAKEFGYSKF